MRTYFSDRLRDSALALCLLVAALLGPATASAGQDTINFNTASSFKLAKVAHVTRDLAKAIVRHRDANGAFGSPQDLLAVPGMSAELLQQIKPWVDDEGNLVAAKMSSNSDSMAIPDY